jgi:hypothetical protein
LKRIICQACFIATQKDRQMHRCHECNGLGYIETFDIKEGCNKRKPICPVEEFFDILEGSYWKCDYCDKSGPLN